ncbi:MAG TPA: hypothetical protein VL981_09745 [Candidatus Methylacidiphilales bacterium]|nr:hypothetical protein [Candidatus Methylacidiphilales bacterium]
MDKFNPTTPSKDVLVEIRPDSDTLVIAFTGIAAKFNSIQPFDFFKITGIFDYNRILIREPWRYCYLKGIDETGFEGLRIRLEMEIQRIAPKTVACLGTSAGGFGAILFGHLLKADYVHAFSPFTYVDLFNLLRGGDHRNAFIYWPGTVVRTNFFLPRAQRRYRDLRSVLTQNNGKTRFYLHACAQSLDRVRVEHLQNCPNVQTFLYPCNTHNVTWNMIKTKCLREMLRRENFDDPAKIYRQFYPNFDPNQPTCEGCTGAGKQIESIPTAD